MVWTCCLSIAKVGEDPLEDLHWYAHERWSSRRDGIADFVDIRIFLRFVVAINEVVLVKSKYLVMIKSAVEISSTDRATNL